MLCRKIIECKAAAAAEADSSDFDTCVASSLAVETAKAAAASEDHLATRAAVAKTPKKKKLLKLVKSLSWQQLATPRIHKAKTWIWD